MFQIIAAMRWEEIDRDHQRISKLRRYEDNFDWDGIKFPASIRDIKRFESRNEVMINILALEDKKVYICRKGKEYDQVANLMLITDHNKKHHVAIKSLKRLPSRQNSKHNNCKTVIAAMRWEEIDRDHQRISKLRRYEDNFDWDGIKFPASIRDIKRFESRNEVMINILALEDKKVYICRKGKEYDQVANLMLITDHNKKHHVAIKSLKRLPSRQNSKHKESQHFVLIAYRDLQSRNLEMNTM